MVCVCMCVCVCVCVCVYVVVSGDPSLEYRLRRLMPSELVAMIVAVSSAAAARLPLFLVIRIPFHVMRQGEEATPCTRNTTEHGIAPPRSPHRCSPLWRVFANLSEYNPEARICGEVTIL